MGLRMLMIRGRCALDLRLVVRGRCAVEVGVEVSVATLDNR